MEAIEASATLRFSRVSPQKARLVADMIRGKKVEDAVKILTFATKKSAGILLKILKSAIANAEVKNVEDPEILEVTKVWVNQAPALRRQRHRARGRANTIRRLQSHITVIVRESVEAKEEAAKHLAAREAKRAKKLAEKKARQDDKSNAKPDEAPAKEGEV